MQIPESISLPRSKTAGRAAPIAITSRRVEAPSLVQLSAQALRDMILAGELRPGQHLVEERLTEQLGVSRVPLREALRLVEREGLITHVPRHGVVVTPVTADDAFEIFTLRAVLERLAVELGVPVRDPSRLQRCRTALDAMRDSARQGDRAGLVPNAFAFHLALVGLAGLRRLEEFYRSLQLQMQLCMAINTGVRQRQHESLDENVDRHVRLLELVENGDPAEVLAELARHGDRAFLDDFVVRYAEDPDAAEYNGQQP